MTRQEALAFGPHRQELRELEVRLDRIDLQIYAERMLAFDDIRQRLIRLGFDADALRPPPRPLQRCASHPSAEEVEQLILAAQARERRRRRATRTELLSAGLADRHDVTIPLENGDTLIYHGARGARTAAR